MRSRLARAKLRKGFTARFVNSAMRQSHLAIWVPHFGSKLVDALFKRNQELDVPSRREFGISEERYFSLISTMAKQALASGSPQNNRIPARSIPALPKL
jgi:hypothetical protein